MTYFRFREEGLSIDYYELNDEQLEAVTTTEGYIRVIAGAGSGKTRALTYRYAYLVNEMGILPENILCVTFTNKAAQEMRQRIHGLIGDLDTGYVNTFHGFCVSVLQEDSYAISYPKSFLVLDNADIDDMLKVIYEERHLTMRDMTFVNARDMIEMRKLYIEPEYYEDLLALPLEGLYQKYQSAAIPSDIIFYGYLYQEKKCFGVDYNDLIVFTLYIFSQSEEIRLKWQKRLEYIMIDEFQDIDKLQYRLMEVLSDYHHNLFVVGDPDQTIYTWRGANVAFLNNFDKQFPEATTIFLLKNYRSSPEILKAANSLISKNQFRIPKDLVPTQEEGESVLFYYGKTSEDEADWVISQLKSLHDIGIPYADMTLLYRAHYVTRPFEEVLLKEKIPYHIYSGVPFFGRAEIKDALSYLRMAVCQDDLSFRRICNNPKRNLGKRRMEFLENHAAKRGITLFQALRDNLEDPLFKGTKAEEFIQLIDQFSAWQEGRPVSEMLASILDKSGYEAMLRTEGSSERLDNLAELKQSIMDYERTCGEEATPAHYLSHVALFTNADEANAGDKVKLMTVHAAKGLEFPYVFLVGLNEGIAPSRKTKDLPGMEEERRLIFVAVTRAMRRLYLSCAEGKNFDGSPRYPSRFVLDIDESLLDLVREPADLLIKNAKAYIEHSEKFLPGRPAATVNLFSPGDHIMHPILGEGHVLEVNPDKGTYLISFTKTSTPRTISCKVKMEKA